MTEETDPVADGLRRAIAAADAANDAAEDIARLGKAQKDFVEKVSRAQKRSSALATGATVGAVVSLALAALVYFRSVGDLHEAAELHVEAAKLVAEQVVKLKEAREGEAEKDDPVAKTLETLPANVAEAVAAKLAEAAPAEGEAAAGDAVTAVEAARDEILAALAEIDLTGAAPRPEASPAAATEAPSAEGPAATPAMAAPADLQDIRESLARIEAGLLRLSAAPAAPTAAAKPASAPPAKAPAAKAAPSKSGGKAAAEPNPFSFP